MSVISKSVFQGRVDRLAKQYTYIEDAVNHCSGVGGGLHYTRVTLTNDYDVENDMIDHSYDIDTELTPANVITDLSTFVNMINDDVTHVTNKGYKDLNDYLSSMDLNVSYKYDDMYYAIRGAHLDAINVFGPSIKMASYTVLGPGAGVYTKGTDVGTGTGACSTTNYAGATVVIRVPLGTIIGAEDIVSTLYLTKEDGTAVTEELTVPKLTVGDGSTDVATTSGVNYISCTNITITGGTAGDKFEVWSKEERVIAL